MKHNKWLHTLWALFLMVCLLTNILPVTVFAAEADEETEVGAFVIPEDAVYLTTAEDLLALAENCVSDAWSRGKVVVLSNDIDLSGTAFDGIPTFGGTFLGQGYTVSGFELTQQQNAGGFFRYLQKSAVVDGLTLRGDVCPAKGGNLQIGGIVGINRGTVKNCAFHGIVTGTEYVGGIAGENKLTGIIENCTVSGTVCGDHYIGGIAGENTGVIRCCVNTAQVNDQVSHNSLSLGITSGLSLESLTEKESASDATNIGGIAGISSGVIRNCENHGAVGYQKMGYNVGGIAGSQIGYITGCSNFGEINGSNGVGGIVGQFRPNVVLNFGDNPMESMTAQMSGMMGSMSTMMGSMSGLMGTMEGMTGGFSSDMSDLEDWLEDLKNSDGQESEIPELDEDSLNAAMNELSKEFQDMYNDMVYTGNQMGNQMDSMMDSMDDMMYSMEGLVGTMERLSNGISIQIIDISKEDTPENTQTKISSCTNFGLVQGETYAGGIAGIADIEDTTVQEDVQGQLQFSDESELIMRLVIRDCRNAATVSAGKEYAGGVVGYMSIGAVINGMNTGNIDSLNANYVGGIAGSCDSYVTGSISRCVLAGNQYVGGIAGFGTEVIGCYAVTDIAASTKFTGGILGFSDSADAGLILNNHYCLTGKNVGGIDGISYEGATAPMTIADFLAVETLDDCFRTVTVRFIADGQEDIVLTVALGENLAVAKIPELEVAENELYHWVFCPPVTAQTLSMGESAEMQYISTDLLTRILFDQTYEAVWDAKCSAISSAEKTESGRPMALAVGAFNLDTVLHLEPLSTDHVVIDDLSVQEIWQVSLSDLGVEKLHYHIPAGTDAEQIVLYVKDISGNWVQRDFTVEGSYMIFPFLHGERAFALCDQLDAEGITVNFTIDSDTLQTGAIVAAGILFVLLVVLFTRKKRQPSGKEPSNE